MKPTSALATLTLLSSFAISPGHAAEVTYDLGLSSAYVWRGITFTDGAVFQPAVTASHDSGFSFNAWGNLDIDDVNGLSGEFQEVDLTASYAFGGDSVTTEIGFIEYLFPNGVGDGTREVYVTLGFDTVLSPSVTVYYDFDEIDDLYATAGVEWGRELSGGWSYSLGLLAAYAGEDFARVAGGTDSGLFNGEANLTLSWERDHVSAGGFIAYSESLDTDVLPDQPVDVYGGVFLGVSF